MVNQCAPWATASELEQAYHDDEWGIPCRDDITLFEFLILETAQAGLSWRLILQRRQAYRAAFADFDPVIVADFSEYEIESLMKHSGIIRNKLKIKSAINNAQCFLNIQKEWGSFSNYLWSFVDNKPIENRWEEFQKIPSQTDLSRLLSREMKKKGFSFVGPTVCYAYMQAIGMVNDHLVSCPRYRACQVSV